MSSALYALGRACFRHRRRVAALWLLALVLIGALAGLFGKGTSEVYSVPGSESQETLDDLKGRFPEIAGTSAQIVVVAPAGTHITDARARRDIDAVIHSLDRIEGVTEVTSPFAKGVSGAVTPERSAALIGVQLEGESQNVPERTTEEIKHGAAVLRGEGYQAETGGSLFGTQAPHISPTEGIGLVIAGIVLVVFFRGLRAAATPIVTAVAGAGVTLSLLMLATAAASITGTAPMLALMIGIAVGIDYSLFLLSRHRENLLLGVDLEDSAARATATAGSAVVFAGFTVITALLGLTIVGLPFLSAMGVAAGVGVAVAVTSSLTLAPALMGFLGLRILPRRRRRELEASRAAEDAGDPDVVHAAAGEADVGADGETDVGADGEAPAQAHEPGSVAAGQRWTHRWVAAVTRWPALTVVLVTVALLVCAVPAKDLRLALPDAGSSPTSSEARRAYDLTARYFGPGQNGPLLVVADIVESNDPVGVMDGLKAELARVPGVARVTLSTPNPKADTGVAVVVPTTGPTDPATTQLVERLRDRAPQLGARYDVTLRVAGQTAAQIDVSDRLAGALLPFALVVMGLSLLLLLIVFRSIVVPLTATFGFVLSVLTAFGVVAAVFEWGWFADALRVARVGPVISFMPIILMGVLFGLAMDYQMFIVSRMHEHYVEHRDATAAVREGFASSAAVVAAAAIIMVGVFAAFVPEGDASLKPIALGLTVGVFVDAFIVRMMLVPALLQLFGRAAWGLPSWLGRRLPHLDVEGQGVAHQIASAAQIEEHPERVVHARDVCVDGPRGVVFDDFDLDLRVGQLCVVEGPEGSGRTAALLTLAGRMPFASGELDVAGAVLPEQAHLVQARVGLSEFPAVNPLDGDSSVRQHIAEQLATTRMLPWARGRDVADILAALDEACDVANRARAAKVRATGRAGPTAGLHVDPVFVDPDTLVQDLPRLTRKILGVVLASVGHPRLVVVDDVDELPTPGDRAGLWAVLGRLARTEPLAVAASCRRVPARLAETAGLPPDALTVVRLHAPTSTKVTV